LRILPLLVFLLLHFASVSLAGFSPEQNAVLDSLAAWHERSRPDLVDSLAAVEIPRALDRGDSAYLLQLRLGTGRARAAFGQVKQAEPVLREVCRSAAAAGDTASWLRGLRWLGMSVGRQGRTAEAAGLHRELFFLARAAGDSVHLALAEIGLAYDQYQAGRSAAAAAGYSRAAGILERAGVKTSALWARNGQGLALQQAGRYQEAGRCYLRVRDLAAELGDDLSEAMALNYLGRLELVSGDPGVAIAYYRRAAAIHKDHNHEREGLLPLLDIARARVIQGDLDRAARDVEGVVARARRLGLVDLELLGVQQLADIHLAGHRPGNAARLCRRALARGNLPSAMVRTELKLRLAAALVQKDSLAAALEVLDPVAGGKAGAVSLQLAVAEKRSRCLLVLGYPEQALACAREGLARVRSSGPAGMRLPLQTLAARAWFTIGRRDSALAEVARATESWELSRSLPADPRWREISSAAASELFTEGAAMMLDGLAGPARAFAFIQRYKARTLRERMHGPGMDPSADAETVTLAGLRRKLLGPGEAFWEVAADREKSVFVLVTPDTILGQVLAGGGAAATEMQKLVDVLASPAVTTAAPAGILAGSLLSGLDPEFRSVLGRVRRLTWCPDGIWHDLPLALLRAGGSGGLLAPVCDLSRVPAAAFLKTAQRTESSAGNEQTGPDILAVLGPAAGDGRELTGAAREVRWLARRFQNVRVAAVPDQAKAARLDWTTTGAIHLAAHTELDIRRPWNTAITLGPGRENVLRAAEVAGLDLQARLAVLGGCRTAGSRIIGGEGMLGLTSAFLAAGVPAVVATLWPVEDEATAVFMTRFYSRLAAGREVATALRLVQEEFRADPALAAPRYWAGFVVEGDGSLTVPLHGRRSPWPAATGLLLVAAGFAWWGHRLAKIGRRNGSAVPKRMSLD